MKSRKERRILHLTMKKVFSDNKPKWIPMFIWRWIVRIVFTDKFLKAVDSEYKLTKNK